MMRTALENFAELVHRYVAKADSQPPSQAVVCEVVNVAFLATLKTEEGKATSGSLTFADPRKPDLQPPLVRAYYPAFTSLGHELPLSASTLVKFSRAVDGWSGSIAVYGQNKADVAIWGVVDQQVHTNMSINREGGGFPKPGIFVIVMDGVGSMLQYCREDSKAIGVIVSQDGDVRVSMTNGRSLVLWEDVKLLNYQSDAKRYLRDEKSRNARRKQFETSSGYTPMPQSLDQLAQFRD